MDFFYFFFLVRGGQINAVRTLQVTCLHGAARGLCREARGAHLQESGNSAGGVNGNVVL